VNARTENLKQAVRCLRRAREYYTLEPVGAEAPLVLIDRLIDATRGVMQAIEKPTPASAPEQKEDQCLA
jgi:hypothetical protein